MRIIGKGQVHANGPIFAPHSAKQILKLFTQGSLARGNHFRDQQARQDAVFLRQMPAYGHSCAFFSANCDFVVAQERPDVLESDRTFVNLHAVQFCDPVQEVRGCHAACSAQFLSTRLQQIIEREAENVIRVNKRTVAVENSESVGVAIGRKPRQSFFLEYSFFKQPEIFLRGIRAFAFE